MPERQPTACDFRQTQKSFEAMQKQQEPDPYAMAIETGKKTRPKAPKDRTLEDVLRETSVYPNKPRQE